MESNRAYQLLQDAIELTPRNPNNSRNCSTTIELLARLLRPDDVKSAMPAATAIFARCREDGTTPAKGYIAFPGYDPFPYEPTKIICNADETDYVFLAEATPEYMKAETMRAMKHAQQLGQRAAEEEWLLAVVAPLAQKYNAPDATVGELAKLLPEPDRTRAEAILYAKVPDEVLPLERVDRQPWHDRIEKAIFEPHKGAISIDDILADAGVEKNSIERPAANTYAQRIIDVLTSYPANVPVPLVMKRGSDRPQ